MYPSSSAWRYDYPSLTLRVANTVHFDSLITKPSVPTGIRLVRFIMGKVAKSYGSLPTDITFSFCPSHLRNILIHLFLWNLTLRIKYYFKSVANLRLSLDWDFEWFPSASETESYCNFVRTISYVIIHNHLPFHVVFSW